MKASHLEYYNYQAEARKIFTPLDVKRVAEEKSYIYDQIVLPRIDGLKNKLIVEAACGHGSFLWWLQSRGFKQILGVDSSAEQVALAKSTGLNINDAEINEWLDLQNTESAGVIVGIDLIEHLSKDEFIGYLRGCHRVLEKNGILILRYPNGDSPLVGLNLFNDITHVWTYTSNAMQSVGAMCGYASASFTDESSSAIRDHRWLKVPLCKLAQGILGGIFRSASRETVRSWSPHIWAFLIKD